MQKTVVFILSDKRSGSTWLSYVLGSHQNAAHLGEYYRPFINPDHVECDICHAVGKVECPILHGIHDVPLDLAYDFAFERYKKDILIDNGKEVTWANKILTLDRIDRRLVHLFRDPRGFIAAQRRRKHLDKDRMQFKIIHLIRDPRGWFASVKRRGWSDINTSIRKWVKDNREMIELAEKRRLPYMAVFYDELAYDPEKYFPELCEFVGMEFEPKALEYWSFEHHGLGGTNGAGYMVLQNYEKAEYKTADDDFYQKNINKRFYDQRWKEQLTKEEIEYIENSNSVRELLAMAGKDINDLAHIKNE